MLGFRVSDFVMPAANLCLDHDFLFMTFDLTGNLFNGAASVWLD